MYSVSNNRAYINGSSGCYDNQIKNNSVRYGRNAIANQKIYLSDLGSKIGTPINFELNYQPKSTKKGNVDFMALLGSAYEEMGKKVSICLKEFNDNLQNAFGSSENQVSIDALDINGDNKIDLSEYATSTLIFDMLSTDSQNLDFDNVDGTITNEGHIASLCLINKKNHEMASQIFSTVHEKFNLDNAEAEFFADKNNLI